MADVRDLWRRIVRRIAGLFGGRVEPTKHELLVQEWGVLKGLWEARKTAAPALAAPVVAEIDGLFAASHPMSDEAGWAAFNDAERRVGALLTPAQLKVEFGMLLQIAAARSLASLAFHTANQALFDDAAKADEALAAYAALLADLQGNFIDTRFRRRLRSEVAERLFGYGVIALIVAIAAPLVLVWNELDRSTPVPGPAPVLIRFSNEPIFAFVMVIAFGALGAYFSRVMAFQASIARLTFDDVMQLYVGRVLRVRMLYGVIGALIFYFLLRSGIVAGELFPKLGEIGIGEQVVWQITPEGVVPRTAQNVRENAGLTVLAPTADMAKLLVWSFLAGFSERLVPDTLSRTEARAAEQQS